MSIKGVDTSATCTSIASSIKNAGYTFVGRYHGNYQMTLEEVCALGDAGVHVVAIWEKGSPTSSTYFSYNKGYSDGKAANTCGMNVDQPFFTPIYFAVDYDASSSAISGVIADYFRGVADAFTDVNSNFKIGVYGSGNLCSYITTNNSKVVYSMLSKSTGWGGYKTYTNWNIKQGSTVKIGSTTFDSDEAVTNYGGWLITMD